MKMVYLFLTTILISSFIYQNESKILWSKSNELKLEDFRKKVPEISDNLATSVILVNYNYEKIEGKVPTFILRTYFIKDSSWIKRKDENTLRHEQLHFDMAELYTRRMRKDIEKLQQKGIEEIEPYIEIIQNYRAENHEADELFDRQCYGLTVNGQVIERAFQHRQEEWIDSIAIELDKLNEYEYLE